MESLFLGGHFPTKYFWCNCIQEINSVSRFCNCSSSQKWLTARCFHFKSEMVAEQVQTCQAIQEMFAVCLCASAQMCACEVTARLRPSLVLEWMINSLTAGWPTVKCAEPALTAGSNSTSRQTAFASVDRPPRPLSQHLINDSISPGSMIWPFDMFA